MSSAPWLFSPRSTDRHNGVGWEHECAWCGDWKPMRLFIGGGGNCDECTLGEAPEPVSRPYLFEGARNA